MPDGDFEQDSFEARLRALARQVGKSVEQAAEQVDLDQIADRIGVSSERIREVAEFASQWLTDQLGEIDVEPSRASPPAARPSGRRAGPHPLDLPTEEQGLALSALDSGRWKVEPGTNEVVSQGAGPDPEGAAGIVSELRARDWIAASGEETAVGRDALRRWMEHGADR
jgi:hypothetical protein